ncbi:MAG: ATP-binding protein [Pseudonocardiaceae bacterium]
MRLRAQLDVMRAGDTGARDNTLDPERIEFKRITVPAQDWYFAALRRDLRRWLAAFPLPEGSGSALTAAVNVVATNANHACTPAEPGTVELAFWTEPGAVCITVSDHGTRTYIRQTLITAMPTGRHRTADSAPNGAAD